MTDLFGGGLPLAESARLKSTAVMARKRATQEDDPELFCTPPWAGRALCELLSRRGNMLRQCSVLEPAAGLGHLAHALRGYFGTVHAADKFDHGLGFQLADFLQEESPAVDWIITNPPFTKAADFALKGISEAGIGVALLCRLQWLEGGDRYTSLFECSPPDIAAVFCERVPMIEGAWDPEASSATAYAWFIWDNLAEDRDTIPSTMAISSLTWIPPGTRERLTRQSDEAYAARGEAARRKAAREIEKRKGEMS